MIWGRHPIPHRLMPPPPEGMPHSGTRVPGLLT